MLLVVDRTESMFNSNWNEVIGKTLYGRLTGKGMGGGTLDGLNIDAFEGSDKNDAPPTLGTLVVTNGI